MPLSDRQIDDRQHHEYEGLKHDHKDVEYRPRERESDLGNQAEPAADRGEAGKSARQSQRRQQQENHLARVQVAVQTQRQRYGAGNEGDRLEDEVHGHQQRLRENVPDTKGLQSELTDETDEALHLQAVEDDEDEDRERQCEGRVQVRARHHFQVLEAGTASGRRQQVDRHEIHEVEQEDPAEDGERERGDEATAAVEGVAHLRVDELDDDLDEVLDPAGHAAGRLAGHQPEQHEKHQRQHDREEHGVVVDHREVDDPVRLPVRQEALVVQDVLGRPPALFRRGPA